MVKNYIKVALRNLFRNKIISSINILGLAASLACCILIIFLIRRELSYDNFHKNPEQIYRVVLDLPSPKTPSLPFPLLPALKNEYPEIAQSTRLFSEAAHIKILQDISNVEILYADSDFFEMFNFPFKTRIHENAFNHPKSVILSNEAAGKYFGTDDPVGRIIEISQGKKFEPFVVRAVVKPIPEESSIKFSFLVPIPNLMAAPFAARFEDWNQFQVTGFIRILDQSQRDALSEKLPRFLKKYMGIDIVTDDNYAQHSGLKFQPLPEYYLGAEASGTGLQNVLDIKYLYVLATVTILILLIACFNFILLSLGQSSTRFKEVGTRKVLGAVRSQLVRQLWLEAMLMSFFALILGVVLAELFLPAFNELIGQNLTLDYMNSPTSILTLLGLLLLIGTGVGGYPALKISRLPIVDIFKGKSKLGGRNSFTRSLIVAQFSLSICLLIIATTITKQIVFMKNKDLGFNTDQVIVIPLQKDSESRSGGARILQFYKNELAENPNITNVSGTSGSFQRGFVIFSFFTQEDGTVRDIGSYVVDADFISTMELKLNQGRNFLSASSDVEKTMIVNETFMNSFPDMAKLDREFPHKILGYQGLRIVGVVKDFHFLSLKRQIQPAALVFGHSVEQTRSSGVDCILIKVRPQNLEQSIDALKSIWQKYQPNLAFAYHFMNEDLESQYKAEEMWRQIILYTSVFAILIACMGLLGLTSLSITKRERELGIRKVLGASTVQLLQLLNREIITLITIANVIAWPVSYYVANLFLESFAYRTSIDFGYFILSGLAVLILTAFSVNSLAINAALKNPVNAIRYE